MKPNDSHLRDHAKSLRQQKGTITLVAMMLVLVTILAITAISSALKEVIIAILVVQVASQSFAGGHENQ